MRTAFFGGSFDPPHLGHIAIARAAQQALHLDQVLFAPVGLQPLKPAGSSASFEHRAAMTALAIEHQPNCILSRLDAPHPDNPQPNYTIDTLHQLKAQLSAGSSLYLLLGADSFRTLHHWRRASEIPFAATLIVASRPHEDIADLPSHLPHGVSLIHQPDTSHPPAIHYQLTNPNHQQADLYLLPDLHYEVSATQLRAEIQSHRQPAEHPSTPQLIAPPVLEYIHQHHLYE